MVAFDPIAIARHCRARDLRLPAEYGRAAFEPDRLGDAGRMTVEALIPAWLVGEGGNYRAALTEALAWLEEGAVRGEGGGRHPPVDALRQRQALGIGRWLLEGRVDRTLWAEAAALSEKVMKAEAPAPYLVSDHMLDCLLAGEPARAEVAPDRAAAQDDESEIAAALALARDTDAAQAVGALYRERLEVWLDERVYRRIAMWAMAAWFETGLATGPDAALLALYAFLEDVPVPPGLAARGWTDAPGPVLIALPAGTAPERLDRAVTALGLVRDPDRATPPAGTAFASWSGPPGDDGEVDYLAENGLARLDLRGRRAAMRGNVLMTLFGARHAPAPDEALASLLTPPPGVGGRANALLRWHMLGAAVAAAGPANLELVRALVAAGLRDPDWRVRMTAVLAVGRLRLAELAEQAMAAKVPDAGTDGLDQEDRRALLALRHAARNLALELPPGADLAGEPQVMAKRIAWQERLRALIDDRAAETGGTADDRAAALVDRLLGGAQ